VLINEAGGPGTVLLVVSGLGGECPDEDGDLIVGRLVLERIGAGEGSITFTTVPGVATWTPLNDADVVPHTLLITDDLDNDGIVNGEDNCPKNYNPSQEDTFPPQGNAIGDACDCESDFNCDGTVDATDVTNFLTDFGRSTFFNPCTNASPCNGDIDCNVNVDANDVDKFLEHFGRSQFFNPCPACVVGAWCVY
jgi:hypothetical protein